MKNVFCTKKSQFLKCVAYNADLPWVGGRPVISEPQVLACPLTFIFCFEDIFHWDHERLHSTLSSWPPPCVQASSNPLQLIIILLVFLWNSRPNTMSVDRLHLHKRLFSALITLNTLLIYAGHCFIQMITLPVLGTVGVRVVQVMKLKDKMFT